MEYFYIILGFVILFALFDINEKLKKLLDKEKKNKLNLNDYLNKDVYIIINNENVTNFYLFSSSFKTVGRILDYDDNWFIFRYYNKSEKQTVTEYLKISDLESINEIK